MNAGANQLDQPEPGESALQQIGCDQLFVTVNQAHLAKPSTANNGSNLNDNHHNVGLDQNEEKYYKRIRCILIFISLLTVLTIVLYVSGLLYLRYCDYSRTVHPDVALYQPSLYYKPIARDAQAREHYID